jgi:hypothetical protein
MALNAFTRELGSQQGRITPAGWLQPEGDFAFVLGFDRAGHVEVLNIGDYCEVSQTAEFSGALNATRILRLTARLRAPTTMPLGTAWDFTLSIDGTVRARRRLSPPRTRELIDIAANVGKAIAGNHTVALRLELVAA